MDTDGYTGVMSGDLHIIPLYPFNQNICERDLNQSESTFCVVNIRNRDRDCIVRKNIEFFVFKQRYKSNFFMQGDSGGPLEYDGIVYGIHGFVPEDCKDKDAFLSVHFFNPWIKINIERNPS